MFLKSSEIHSCSRRVSTVLLSFLVSSSFFHIILPFGIRCEGNTGNISGEFLELSRIDLPHYLLEAHVVHDEADEPISSLFHSGRASGPSSFSIGILHGEEPTGFLLFGFALAFDGHAKSFASHVNAYPSSWISFRSFLHIVVQIHQKLVWSMRNSDLGESTISVHRRNSDLNSVFTMQATSCKLQYGPNFGVPFDPPFWLWCFFFSWRSVFTTGNWMK